MLVEHKVKFNSIGEFPCGKSCDVAETHLLWATKRSFVDIIALCFLGSQPEMDGYLLLVYNTIIVSTVLFLVHG